MSSFPSLGTLCRGSILGNNRRVSRRVGSGQFCLKGRGGSAAFLKVPSNYGRYH